MIKSETGLGEIYAGDTGLAFTSTFEQPDPQTLTLTAGVLTLTNGVSYSLPETTFTLADGVFYAAFGLDGDGHETVRLVSPLGAPDFTLLQMLAGFGSGIAVQGGAIVGDIYVLHVLAEFPDA